MKTFGWIPDDGYELVLGFRVNKELGLKTQVNRSLDDSVSLLFMLEGHNGKFERKANLGLIQSQLGRSIS